MFFFLYVFNCDWFETKGMNDLMCLSLAVECILVLEEDFKKNERNNTKINKTNRLSHYVINFDRISTGEPAYLSGRFNIW